MFMIEVKIMWIKISCGSQGRPYIDFRPFFDLQLEGEPPRYYGSPLKMKPHNFFSLCPDTDHSIAVTCSGFPQPLIPKISAPPKKIIPRRQETFDLN